MPTIFDEWGAPSFNLLDCKIAKNNLNGTFGVNVDVPSVQLLGMTLRTMNAELTGDATITAAHSIIIGGTCQFRFGSVPFTVFEVLTGLSSTYSNSTPNRARILRLAASTFPYFAIMGRAQAVEGVGDFQIFAPKCKLMEGFEVRLEYGAFAIPDVRGSFLPDPSYIPLANTVMEMVEYEATKAIVIPPTY